MEERKHLHLLYFAWPWAHQRHRQCCIYRTAPEGGTFVPCDTFYAPMHTINYLWHGKECCTDRIQHSLPWYNYYIVLIVYRVHTARNTIRMWNYTHSTKHYNIPTRLGMADGVCLVCTITPSKLVC